MINKVHVIASVFALNIATISFAAVQSDSSVNVNTAIELLKVPTEIRKNSINGKADRYYKPFVDIAFSNENAMSLRWRALMAAAEVNGVKATDDLKKAGEHDAWFMRNAALVALTEVNPHEASKLAQKLLKDKALVVRSAAVDVLQKDSALDVRELLWKELNQKYNYKGAQSLWIRHQIVEVLAKSPKSNELKTFANLLNDKDTRLYLPAINGLEKLTGVKLGQEKQSQADVVALWRNYLVKDHIDL